MKFEKLSNNNNSKKVFLYGFITCAVLLILFNIIFSYAKYKVVDSVKLASGTVNYESADFSLIALYIQNGNIDNPSEGYKKIEDGNVPQNDVKLNETKTVCKINSEEYIGKTNYESQGIFIAYKKGKLNFTGINKANTKCTVYFDYGSGTADDTLDNLFSDFTTLDSGTNFSKDKETGVLKVTGADTEDHPKTLYKAEDNDGTSYFFRGQANDNWVQFANMRWRIIRINGDGTIRMIFQCSGASCTNITGTETNAINKISYNSTTNDNTYVGYYNKGNTSNTYEEAHNGLTPSTIVEEINSWYEKNLTSFEKYIDTDAGFCNDRQIVTGEESSYDGTGYGKSPTSYAAWGRVQKNIRNRKEQLPTLKCGVNAKTADEQETSVEVNNAAYQRDLFTKIGAKKGNKALKHPIGLITSDELLLAGGFGGENNSNFYLYTNQVYWTMSPHNMSITGTATIYVMHDKGNPNSFDASNTWGARPVINLKASVTFEKGGNGTINNPYIVELN